MNVLPCRGVLVCGAAVGGVLLVSLRACDWQDPNAPRVEDARDMCTYSSLEGFAELMRLPATQADISCGCNHVVGVCYATSETAPGHIMC